MTRFSKSILTNTALFLICTFPHAASALELAGGKKLANGATLNSRSTSPQRPATNVRRPLFWFWNDSGNRSNGDVNVIYGDESNRNGNVRSFDGDPEGIPGLGMGNLTYDPPLSVPIYDAVIGKLPSVTGDAELIRLQLSDKASPVRTSVAHRKAILEFYERRDFSPVWFSDGKLSPRALQALGVLATAGSDGLQVQNYLPFGLTSFQSATAEIAGFTESQAAQFDVSLTTAVLRYASHLNSGQFEPARLSEYNDIKIAVPDLNYTLQIVTASPYPEEFLNRLAPSHPAYQLLKQELAKLTAEGGESARAPFPDSKKLVKTGQRDARIPELRSRLEQLGFLGSGDALVSEESAEILDKPLASALKDFQTANGIKATGILNAAVVAKLNSDPLKDKRAKVIASMERIRWLPKDLGSRYVFVNQAAFTAEVIEGGIPVWKTKVIVGKPLNQSASFSDEFETVVFNPSWGIPQSILVNEYLPKLRRDPSYLDRIGYKVSTESGQPISSSDVDWWSYGNVVPFNVQQPPGDDNALGELKFLFPNEHAIYMHDTPTKKLFADRTRAYSHGCIRVENPRKFASVLLGWDEEKVASEVELRESFSVPVAIKTKVHLTYFAAWPDETGTIRYYGDVYERDRTLNEAFSQGSAALALGAEPGLTKAALIQPATVTE